MFYQKYKLKDLTNINSGFSFRTKVQNNPSGNTFVIQMRDISADRSGITNEPLKINGEMIHKSHLLKNGDVLFVAKGAKNLAVCYDEQFKPAVAASAFFVIRIRDKNLISPYLCWYLNSVRVQTIIKGQSVGTYIPNVNKSTLAELEVIIPPIRTQEMIANIHNLFIKEAELLDRIKEKRSILVDSILSNQIFNGDGNKRPTTHTGSNQ